MKKSILAVAMAMGLGSAAVQAASIDITTMKFYDAGGNPQFFGGGLNTSVNGSVNDSVTGTFTSGGTNFFGTPWTATQQMWNNTAGTGYTWAGTSPQGAYSYTYDLAAGQSAMGVYFTWGAAVGIAVLQIFSCDGTETAGTACNGVTWDPAHGDTPTSHAVPGTYMANGPFANQHATFSGVVSASVVPVPAAVWLFGSGLLGLVGVARRKKQA